MIYVIYLLKNPITNEVVYIGKTSDLNLKHYLNSKYWKLNEVIRGDRNITPLFKLMKDLLPNKLIIESIKYVDENEPFSNSDFYEAYYIKKYSEQYKLLNVTDGGTGGNTYKYKSIEEIKNIGEKVSKKLKGRKKPKGFGEHLSNIRKGINNPMSKKLIPKIGAFKGFELVKVFNYGFEINEFIGSKHAYNNVNKVLKGKVFYNPYGYNWNYINE